MVVTVLFIGSASREWIAGDLERKAQSSFTGKEIGEGKKMMKTQKSSYSNLIFKKMDTGKILLGALAGLAVGTTLGILFAPDKGSNTRKKIVKKGSDFGSSVEDKLNEFIEFITKQYEEVGEASKKVAHNGMNVIKEGVDRVDASIK